MTTRITIVGGGLAGLAAAEALTRPTDALEPNRTGVQVTLLEARRATGGRAGSFVDARSGERVDHCQHVAMGCCTNFIDFITRLGLGGQFTRYDELTFMHRDAGESRFRASRWLPAPFHLAASFGALKHLNWTQKRRIAWAVHRLMRMKPDTHRQTAAAVWLRDNGQDERTIREFWDVFLVSALGERTDHVGIVSARKVVLEGFAVHRHASDVWVPNRPLADLFGDVALQVLSRRGVETRVGSPVHAIATDEGMLKTIVAGRDSVASDAVILAVPWHSLDRILWNEDEALPIQDLNAIVAIPASPITGLHLWFDRPITDRPHAVLVGTLSQWVFRNPCESADRWSAESGASASESLGHYVQVVISASESARSMDRDDLLKQVLSELRGFFPPAVEATLLRSKVVTDPKSVYSIRPEVDAIRPAATTDHPQLFLAGDWVQTGWPATMEGAVRSGRNAAAAAMKMLGRQPPADTPDLSAGWLARRMMNRSSNHLPGY